MTRYERNINRLRVIKYLSNDLCFEISYIEDDYNLRDFSKELKEIKSKLMQIFRLSREQFFCYDDYLDMEKYCERVLELSDCIGFSEKKYKNIANKISKLNKKISNIEMD